MPGDSGFIHEKKTNGGRPAGLQLGGDTFLEGGLVLQDSAGNFYRLSPDTNGILTSQLITLAEPYPTNSGGLRSYNNSKYRRPNLVFISISTVDVEANTDTTSQRAVMFPDGEIRLSTTQNHFRFDITRNTVLSGNKQSGLRTGLSQTNNTWYALYAVKASDNTSDLLLVGDTLLPLQANVATLNANFGTNAWVYLGMVRNGNNNDVVTGILSFVQTGNTTSFTNATLDPASAVNINGTLLASNTATVADLTYSYSAGTGAAQIPNHLSQVFVIGSVSTGTLYVFSDASTATRFIRDIIATGPVFRSHGPYAVAQGFFLQNNATLGARTIFLRAWIDLVLGIGVNPFV